MKESRERRLLNSQETSNPEFIISLKSPTVIQACKKLHISVNDLKPISYDKFKKRQVDLTIPDDVLYENWVNREKKRVKLMQKVVNMKQKIHTFDSINEDKSMHHRKHSYGLSDYNENGRNHKLRQKNVSRVSVSYTKSDSTSKPIALEIKYGEKPKYHDKTHFNKNIDELRERQIESQQKLHKYLDEMFEKEQRDKERQQKYLHLK